MLSDIAVELFLGMLLLSLSAWIGYFAGAAKSFREQKQSIYSEIIPTFIKVAYDPKQADTEEFNKALTKLWLFGSRKVALKMNSAISILHESSRGNLTEALQEAIVEIRSDLQFSSEEDLLPSEVTHIFTKITGENQIPDRDN